MPIGQKLIFCIYVTFKKKTVLYRICLFIDNIKTSDRIFISNGDCREESWIAERQREGEVVRGRILRKRRDGIGHKMSH